MFGRGGKGHYVPLNLLSKSPKWEKKASFHSEFPINPNSTSKRRFHLPLAIATAIILFLGLFFLLSQDYLPHSFALTLSYGNDTLKAISSNGLAVGSWVKETSLLSYDELSTQYDFLQGCYAKDPQTGSNVLDQRNDAAKHRQEEIMSWKFVPKEKGEVIQFEVKRFIEQMAKSRYGLVLVGDSLTGQMFGAFQTLLRTGAMKYIDRNSSEPPPEVITSYLSKGKGSTGNWEMVERLILNTNHPIFAHLYLDPLIPPDRFDYPIITFLRTSLLLSFDQVERILREELVVGDIPINLADGEFETDWVHWAKHMFAKPWEGEEKGTWVINTGPHFSPLRMPASKGESADGPLRELYKRTVFHALPELLSLPGNPNIIYRSTSAAHASCNPKHVPSTNTTSPLHFTNGYGWENFPFFNQIWKDAIDALPRQSHRVKGSNVFYFDIYSMSIQRPDAHLLGELGTDCLHWCQPSVTSYWAKFLWHIMEMEYE